jgi:hypothetical protein
MSDDMVNSSSSNDDSSSRSLVAPRTTKRFRFSRILYLVIVIWEAMGIVFSVGAFWASAKEFWPIQILSALCFHLPCIVGVWWIERLRIDADESGLRLRGPIRTHFIAWDSIEDFGLELPSSNQHGVLPPAVLVTPNRKWKLSRLWLPFDELLELVALRATQARTSQWGLIGTRDCDSEPQTFVHRDTPGWIVAAWFVGFSLLMLLRVGVGTSPSTASATIVSIWSALSVWGRVGFVLCGALMIFGLPTLMVAMRFMGRRAKRRFLEQHVVATREGLELWNGPSRLSCAWREVERFELETMCGSLQLPLCVVFARGQRFEWHSGIENGRLLREIVAARALNASTRDWKYASGRDEDNLRGELSLWPSGLVGVGPKRYHYGTRTNRALLFFVGALTAPFPIFSVYGRVVNGTLTTPTWGDQIAFALIGGTCCVVMVLGALGFFRSSLETDDEKMRHNSIFGVRVLKWSEIRRVVFNGYWLEIKGDATTIRVGFLVDMEHLLEEIERKSGVKCERTNKSQGV